MIHRASFAGAVVIEGADCGPVRLTNLSLVGHTLCPGDHLSSPFVTPQNRRSDVNCSPLTALEWVSWTRHASILGSNAEQVPGTDCIRLRS